jgi:hypothetical protein
MRKRYNQIYHKPLRRGSGRKRTRENLGTRKGGGYFSTKKNDLKYNIWK